MSGSEKKTSSKATSSTQPDSGGKKAKAKAKPKRNEGARETFESIAIAFALAFVFKTFQAEAYVIPTGSMAPTLYGRHKEIACEGCGYEFAFGASLELNQASGQLVRRITEIDCPNCGKNNDAKDAPVYTGDRIVVNKQVSEFRRFDVVVFKNPEEGHVNYIKRLVGLPGETIRIRKGDLWAKSSADDEWQIQRKQDPEVQKEIQIPVYDDNFPPTALLKQGWPERWVPALPSVDDESVGGWTESENAWKSDRANRIYSASADTSPDWQWLTYRHFQPNQEAWRSIESSELEIPYVAASLVTDVCAFNENSSGTFWVGDLTLNATVSIESVTDQSMIRFQLVEGLSTYNATVSLASGEVVLSSAETGNPESEEIQIASGSVAPFSADEYEFAFANVDDRLCVWVNGVLVEFDAPTEYSASDLPNPVYADLAPCQIAVRGMSASVSNLLVQRDIYYQNEFLSLDEDSLLVDTSGASFVRNVQGGHSNTEIPQEHQLQSLLSNPSAWAKLYQTKVAEVLATSSQYCEYQLADDEYLMFGDNSPASKDSRLFDYYTRPMNGVFSHRYAVREKDLIGKALFIFWPHGVPFLNDGKGIPVWYHKGPDFLDPDTYPSVRLPFYPNISRMKKIR